MVQKVKRLDFKFFSFYDENTYKSYVMPIDLDEMDDDFYEDRLYPEIVEIEEKHGTIDFVTEGDNQVIGFISNEVEDIPAFLDDWKKVLAKLNVKVLGPVQIYKGEVRG